MSRNVLDYTSVLKIAFHPYPTISLRGSYETTKIGLPDAAEDSSSREVATISAPPDT